MPHAAVIRNKSRQCPATLMKCHRFPSATVPSTAMATALLFVTGFVHAVAAEPSAAEIVEASKAAMSQPLRYRVLAGGTEMVVYQKTLSDGSLAQLVDMSSPIKRINIIYGDKSYELYLDHGVAIDTHFMYQAAKDQAATISSVVRSKAAVSSRIVGTVTRDHKDCFVIESTFASEMTAELARSAALHDNDAIPATYRYVIDKHAYLMVELEIISKSGFSLSKCEFKDITPQPDLSDDFFSIPASVEVKRPASLSEYVDLITDILSPPAPAATAQAQRRPPVAIPPPTPVARLRELKPDPLTGRMTFPGDAPADIKAQSINTGSISTGRLLLVLFNLALFGLAAAFTLRRFMSSRRNPTLNKK